MIIELLKHYNIIKQGKFQLKSGEISNMYIDLKKVISFPHLHQKICNKIIDYINKQDIYPHLICGTPYGAISYASYISIKQNIPMIFLRKEQKTYGTKNLIEGNYHNDQKVILIEDVVTTGSSVIEAAKILEAQGLIISHIITIFSRASTLHLQYKNIPIEYLYHITEIDNCQDVMPTSPTLLTDSITSCTTTDSTSPTLAPPTLRKIIKEKNTKICLAADVDTTEKLLSLVEMAGPHICMLKIHSDIIKDFHKNYEYTRIQLIKLKNLYNFKIWEDRKFADIGTIMRKQITMHISDWADIISVHPIAGQDSLNQLNIGQSSDIASNVPPEIEIILIAEMSSSGHLMNEEYQQKVVDMAYNTNNVIGIVAQHPIEPTNTQQEHSASNSNSKPLYIVPGISLDKKSDNQGQNYNSPDKKQFADVYVIGRGIYEAEDPLLALEKYKAL